MHNVLESPCHCQANKICWLDLDECVFNSHEVSLIESIRSQRVIKISEDGSKWSHCFRQHFARWYLGFSSTKLELGVDHVVKFRVEKKGGEQDERNNVEHQIKSNSKHQPAIIKTSLIISNNRHTLSHIFSFLNTLSREFTIHGILEFFTFGQFQSSNRLWNFFFL